MKTFTIDEAQSLLPVLESLLKRAIEGKQAAEQVESSLSELARRIYISGGMKVDAAQRGEAARGDGGAPETGPRERRRDRRDRRAGEGSGDRVCSIFPAGSTTRWCCSAGAWARPPSSTGTRSSPVSRAASRSMSAFAAGQHRADSGGSGQFRQPSQLISKTGTDVYLRAGSSRAPTSKSTSNQFGCWPLKCDAANGSH